MSATRTLFDARGMRDANIDDIARAVGINRTIIYRHVASKEELFALTMVEYLKELQQFVDRADDPAQDPRDRFDRMAESFTQFCTRYPAFLDCAFALMRKPGHDLLAEIGDAAALRLGRLMGMLLGRVSAVLRAGDEAGVFTVSDPDLVATALYTQILGTMHLARLGFYVREAAPNVPEIVKVSDDQIRALVLKAAISSVLTPVA